jgi:hypothetical protein
LYTLAQSVLNRILQRRTRVRRMHLRLTDLSFGLVQLNLFADPKPDRRAKLELALDNLRHRYGATVIHHVSGRRSQVKNLRPETCNL